MNKSIYMVRALFQPDQSNCYSDDVEVRPAVRAPGTVELHYSEHRSFFLTPANARILAHHLLAVAEAVDGEEVER